MIADKEFLRYNDGVFKPYFERYIEFKRGKGEKVAHSALIRLGSLNNALNRHGILGIPPELAEEILMERPGESPGTRQLRVSDLRQFASFLQCCGTDSYVVPFRYTAKVNVKFRPHIFSDAELVRVIRVVDGLPLGRCANGPIGIYPVMIRILSGTGIRISEALSLTRADVDADHGILKVINSKNGVSRCIPMSDSLASVLGTYLNTGESYARQDAPLFQSSYTGKAYSYETIRRTFQKTFTMANVRSTSGKIPNIHSLRHTFCTKSLEKMLEAGMNLYVALPILSAYVGHVNISDTEQYYDKKKIMESKLVAMLQIQALPPTTLSIIISQAH